MSMSAIFGGIGRALGHRVYRLYWFGNSTAMVGRWMHRMAVGWLTWELTESTSWDPGADAGDDLSCGLDDVAALPSGHGTHRA